MSVKPGDDHNIFFAKPADYVKATQKVTIGGADASYISLPITR